MDNIVGYYGSSSPEELQEKENGAGPPPAENSDEHNSSNKSTSASSSSRDKSSSPDHCSNQPYQRGNQRRSSYKERSMSHSPPRFERRSSPDRRSRYRRSRSRSQERYRRSRSPPDRHRRSRSHSQERRRRSRSRSQERRHRSRSLSQERRRRSRSCSQERRHRPSQDRRQRSRSRSQERRHRSRSRSLETRSHYGRRSPQRQYGRNSRPSPPPHRRDKRPRSPVKRRYPSTPVVIPNRSKQPDGSTTGDLMQADNTTPNIPGATPEQRLENALSSMQQHRPVRPGGMSLQQFQAVQEKRKQLWKKKTPPTSTQWDAYAATFSQSGGSTAGDVNEDPQAKFRRLMGMKGDNKPLNQDTMQKSSEIMSKQNKLLADLDQQYEESRFLTHRARGVGFGFGGSIVSNLTKTEGVVSEKGPEDK